MNTNTQKQMNPLEAITRLLQVISDAFGDFCATLKPYAIMIATWLLSVVSPVKGALIILSVSFLGNIIYGVVAATNKKNEEFSIKKFFSAFKELLLWGCSAVLIHQLGRTFDEKLLIETGVKWVTYIAVWGYVTNVFKNAKLLHPSSKPIAIAYSFLSTEVLLHLKHYIGLKKNKTNEK